jgi:hypothetical protein
MFRETIAGYYENKMKHKYIQWIKCQVTGHCRRWCTYLWCTVKSWWNITSSVTFQFYPIRSVSHTALSEAPSPKHSHTRMMAGMLEEIPPSNYSKLTDLLQMSGKYRSNIQLEALSLKHFYVNKVNKNIQHMKHLCVNFCI